MEEHKSNGKALQSQPKPNLELYFAIPAQHTEGMSDEDWDAEMERMFKQSLLTRDFVRGQLSPEDYSDGLADLGENPYHLGELWENGISLYGL